MPTSAYLMLSKKSSISGIDASGVIDLTIGSTTALSGTLNELFDAVQPAEAAAGRTDYRLILISNTHPSEEFVGLKAYISTQTSSPSTSLEIGLAIKTDSNTITAITAETTAPAGVTFSAAPNLAGAITIGDLPAPIPGSGTNGHTKGLWLKRIVAAGAAATANDASVIVITNAA